MYIIFYFGQHYGPFATKEDAKAWLARRITPDPVALIVPLRRIETPTE